MSENENQVDEEVIETETAIEDETEAEQEAYSEDDWDTVEDESEEDGELFEADDEIADDADESIEEEFDDDDIWEDDHDEEEIVSEDEDVQEQSTQEEPNPETEFRGLAKDILKALGYETEEGKELEALKRFRSELVGENAEIHPPQSQTSNKEFENLIRQDLNEIKAVFPEAKGLGSIMDMPNKQRFAELRDKGLTAVEAYSAINPQAKRLNPRNSNLNNKNHLQSNVLNGSRSSDVQMTTKELKVFRNLFPNKSDKEIRQIYLQSKI